MTSKRIKVGVALSAVTSALGIAVYSAYYRDITSARKRIARGKIINTSHGQIQYAEVGRGTTVLAIHGAGGGFDQGLFTARGALGKDMEKNYHVIALSRFGYLGTVMPPSSSGDASPAAQADAFAALLDALGIHDEVVVVAASAGALSSMQFAIKYPDRVSALILEVPDSWKPPISDGSQTEQLMANEFIINTVLRSDFIMWTFTKIAKDQMISFLGAPPALQNSMTPKEQQEVSELINLIFPVSKRQAGIINDSVNSQNLQRFPLENISTPTLIIDVKDVSTFPGSKYTAEHIPNAKLVAFETGGHLLIGHGEDTRAAIKDFLKQQQQI